MAPSAHRRWTSPRLPSSLGLIFLWTAVANNGGGGAAETAASSHYSRPTPGSSSSEDECPDLLPLPRHALEFYINGTWLPPAEVPANTLEVVDPSLGLPISRISLGTASDAHAAIRAAREALPSWSESSIAERRLYVKRLLKIYRRRREEVARLISAEMGSPIDRAREEQAGSGVRNMRQFLSALEYFEAERPVPGGKADGSSNTVIRYEPVGVVALITPWNWPMSQVTLKVVPALLVGCTCVLKPSEMAPLSSLLFAEMIHEAGFPPGVFNLVNGDGDGVGAHLSSHEGVDMVSFTGSTRAGRLISQAAASSNLKRVSLELGGKGANLIFDDVGDGLGDVVRAGVRGCYDNSGQNCNAPTRMLVERGSYDEAVRIATEAALDAGARVRPARLPGDHLGPVASGAQFERVQGHIQSGIDGGARLAAGGTGRPEGSNPRGFFVKPTLFVDVAPDMTIAREEIFGPVLCIMPFDSEEEAVEIANGTPYGLTNYVHTNDRERRRRLARSLKSGMIEMNGIEADGGAPFAAMKASGNGQEGGIYGLEEYTVIKVVSGVE
jgi:aldehyde dehydrogenase (NAD+)